MYGGGKGAKGAYTGKLESHIGISNFYPTHIHPYITYIIILLLVYIYFI